MNNIDIIEGCANCGACYNICPCGAISVNNNGLFYTPNVNSSKCIECGLCIKVCPLSEELVRHDPIRAYAGWHNDRKVVRESSSGGAFFGIAEWIIRSGGVVFGMDFSNDFTSLVAVSSDEVPLTKIQKSKYVESLVGESFRRVKEELKSGRYVLFCGTPCQIAGLKKYLGNIEENLLTCDFACGGVPSHRVFAEYLERISRKYKSKVKSIDFRPKSHGWKRYAILIEMENGKKYNRLGSEDAYLRSYLNGKLTVRDSCLKCKYPDCHASDITLADFWKYKQLSDLENENGISLVLCNNEKGVKIINSIKDQFYFVELPLPESAYNNVRSSLDKEYKMRHDRFITLCGEKGFWYSCDKETPLSIKTRIKSFIVRQLKRVKD